MNNKHAYILLFSSLALISCFSQKSVSTKNQYKHDFNQETNRIVFIGDTQKTNKLQFLNEKNIGIQDSLFKKISSDSPDLLIHLGDLVELGSSLSDWNEFDKFSAYIHENKIPFLSVLGNHEYHGNNKKALSNFFSRFGYFKNKESWFSFVLSGLGFILINSNEDEMSLEEMDLQFNWFNNKIEEFNKADSVDYIIVVCHHPPYTNMDVQYFKNALPLIHSKDWSSGYIRKNYSIEFMKSDKARLFVSGHTHSYEHFIFEGKHFIVSGGGGGPRDPINLKGSYEDVFNGPVIRNFNYCRLTRDKESWIFEMLNYSEDKKWEVGDKFVIN